MTRSYLLADRAVRSHERRGNRGRAGVLLAASAAAARVGTLVRDNKTVLELVGAAEIPDHMPRIAYSSRRVLRI